jgi:flagellar hook assembly protein FlgD
MVVTGVTVLGGGGPQTGADPNIPKVFALSQNNPNPFTKTTVIRYQLPRTEHATLKVYDVTGRLVRTLVNGKMKPGYYTLDWDGKDNKKRSVASGIYFLRFEAAEFSSRKKMTLLR